MFQCYIFIFALGFSVITSSNCDVEIHSRLPSICYASSTTSCSGNLSCSTDFLFEWLYPNFTVITTTDKTARVYIRHNILIFNNPMISDAGDYTCRLFYYNSIKDHFTLTVIANATFVYSSNLQLREAKTPLRYHDTFINCSVQPTNTFVIWKYRGVPLDTSNSDKYTQNSSGLIIHNVTNEDEGLYVCLIDQTKKAFISIDVIWSPVLLSQQNQTIIVNVSTEVTLNCTVSALPVPVYSWSFPDSCISCPNTSNESVLIFTLEDIADSGGYTCVAENEYGNASNGFSLHVASKPVMNAGPGHSNAIIMEQRRNVMLTCGVQYAYPAPNIEWNITTPSSSFYATQQNGVTVGYKLYSNRSIEIYHQFLLEEGNIAVTCSATNIYGSSKEVFQLWEEQNLSLDFTLYIINLTDCQQLAEDTTGELLRSLQWWFNSTFGCGECKNLYYSNLTCINEQTGIVTSKVHPDHLLSAQELIAAAIADIQTRNPPVVHLSHGWILCLNISSGPTKSEADFESEDNSSLNITILITICVTSLCAILTLLLCITTGMIYIKYKRQVSNATSMDSDEGDNTTHIYDEVKKISANYSKATDDKSALKHEVVFDAVEKWQQPPTYQLAPNKTTYNNCKLKCNHNDYISNEPLKS